MSMPNFAYARPRSLQEAFPHLSSGTPGSMPGEPTCSAACATASSPRRRSSASAGSMSCGASNASETEPSGSGPWPRWPSWRTMNRQGRLSRPCPGRFRGRQPPAAQPGDDRGKPLPEAAVLVLPGGVPLHPQGGQPVLRLGGREPVPLHPGREGVLYRPSLGHRARACGAYGAAVEIVKAGGKRIVPVEKFFVLPEQSIIKETVSSRARFSPLSCCRPAGEGLQSSYRKVRARGSWDFALAGVALALRFQRGKVAYARIVLSGAAPIPWRCIEAEKVITGQSSTKR